MPTYNPWAGLASYEDPATAQHPLQFCGRDDESYDVAKLIGAHIVVTLYGKSGVGKTSLLNAGVFPELREDDYLPISCRLGIRNENDQKSYQDIIITAIENAAARTETINVIDPQPKIQADDFLWNYFARHRFYNKNGDEVTPVIVLDQFEELFRHKHEWVENLLRQLHYLTDKDHTLDSCEIGGYEYHYKTNFRFVISIREDDLYRLEDCIDNCYLSSLKRCRYRLRGLSDQSASDAILIPGKGLFRENECTPIANTIIAIARNQDDNTVSTNILSLICNRIFAEAQRLGLDHIPSSLVNTFVQGNPFEKFYNEATAGFSNREKSYIEDHLVDSTGRRNSVPETDFLLHVPGGAALLKGDNRILQRTSTSSDGSTYRVELIHDSFCAPLSIQKEKRAKRRRAIALALATIFAIISTGVILVILDQKKEIQIKSNDYINASKLIIEEQNKHAAEMDTAISLLQKDSIRLDSLNQSLGQINYDLGEKERSLSNLLGLLKADKDSLTSTNAKLEEQDRALKVYSRSLAANQSRMLAEKAVSLIDENSYLARLLAMQALDYHYTQEAESALRQACYSNTTTLHGHTDQVTSAVFSPDGNVIASASQDNTLRLWEVATGRCLHTVTIPNGMAKTPISFSNDGRKILSAAGSNTLIIWDATNASRLHSLKGHTASITSANFSPDGRHIVSASRDCTLRIWDAATGRPVCNPLEGHNGPIYSASFSPDGMIIMSVSEDSTLRLWDASTGKELTTIKDKCSFVSASFSNDGKLIASTSSNNSIRLWNADNGRLILTFIGNEEGNNSVFFSPDDKYLISAKDDTLRLFDVSMALQTQRKSLMRKTFSHLRTFKGHTALFSPDGKTVVTTSKDNTLRIYNLANGSCLRTMSGYTQGFSTIAMSKDGCHIVSTSEEGTLHLWDIATSQPLLTISVPAGPLAFNPDGELLVETDRTHNEAFDPSTGKKLYTLQAKRSTPLPTRKYKPGLRSSPDGRYSIQLDNKYVKYVIVRDNQGRQDTLKGHTSRVNDATFSPDGCLIVTASDDKTLKVWDVTTSRCLHTLRGHKKSVLAVCYTPDGKYLVSASSDKTLKIWDVNSPTGGRCIQTLEGHASSVTAVAVSPDGKHFASASNDGTIKIWYFPTLQELIDQNRQRFKNRPLTAEEKRQYFFE